MVAEEGWPVMNVNVHEAVDPRRLQEERREAAVFTTGAWLAWPLAMLVVPFCVYPIAEFSPLTLMALMWPVFFFASHTTMALWRGHSGWLGFGLAAVACVLVVGLLYAGWHHMQGGGAIALLALAGLGIYLAPLLWLLVPRRGVVIGMQTGPTPGEGSPWQT